MNCQVPVRGGNAVSKADVIHSAVKPKKYVCINDARSTKSPENVEKLLNLSAHSLNMHTPAQCVDNGVIRRHDLFSVPFFDNHASSFAISFVMYVRFQKLYSHQHTNKPVKLRTNSSLA